VVEIIKRAEGHPSEKQQIDGNGFQVSYNSWGHLAIRVMQSMTGGNDTLVVFDSKVSSAIIGFCQTMIRPRPEPISKPDIPF
jgi:hypothetical protein